MPPLALSRDDLAAFADLGTAVETEGTDFNLVRNGLPTKIVRRNSGYAVIAPEGLSQFASGAAVLADARFADLSQIALNQAILLSPQRMKGNPVPVTSNLSKIVGEFPQLETAEKPWQALDYWLRELKRTQPEQSTDLLLIDGPAGVGKTTIVREAALLRAETYDGSEPLIVQIASRGRVLQNISDLIAFTLQDIRSGITVGQLLSLMRHGLIILAIDGFDELSDPNGFQTAWSGLNSIVSSVRGMATFLLAGRETFVSTDLMQRQLKSFNDNQDRLAALSINDPSPAEARGWLLQQRGWSQSLLSKGFIEPIFVDRSYALRPFFLDLISREPKALASDVLPAPDLLSFLVDVMTRREAEKFLEVLDPPEGNNAARMYEDYVCRFLEEVARDLAENQSESISEDALDLLATVAADGILPYDQVAAVVRRARTVVFLANDLRPGHVAFSHEQLLQHFLAREAIRSIAAGEKPRYVRRNLFGRESLQVFAHVARRQEHAIERFLAAVRVGFSQISRDRTNSNLAVLGIAAACATAPEDANLKVQGVEISEMFFPFSPPPGITIRDTTISIMHASRIDLRQLRFDDGVLISTLETDRQTVLPKSMPMPQVLVRFDGIFSRMEDIRKRIASDGEMKVANKLIWPKGMAELLGRVERYKAFWLRTNLDDTDGQGRQIVSHPDWTTLYKSLRRLDLVVVQSRQASGTRANFVHFRQDVSLLECKELYDVLMKQA